jgi:hypothetical protein
MRKVSSAVRPVPPIEAVSRYKPAADAFTSNAPKNYGGGARLILISVPRVKWLERPEIEIEVRKPNAR